MTTLALPTFEDVRAAAQRMHGHAHRTPVLRSATLDQQLGAQVFFKCENFQRMGAFKFRGAFNALAQFTPEQKRAGVVAYSSGNHAQAIALSARMLGMPATLIMPHDASPAKLAATRGYGAQVVHYDRYSEDAHVLCGQGTAALELFEEVGELDHLFVCLGGGGLLSGSALSARALSPHCKVYGVEPEAGNDVQQSFRSGQRVRIPTPVTIADGAQTPLVGELTFELIRRHVDNILTATDAQLVQAMRFYAERMKMVVEPTGCLSLAAACHAGVPLKGQRVGVLISGGNVDLQRFAELLQQNSTQA